MPSSPFLSTRFILGVLPYLHFIDFVLCFCLLGFVVYAYRVRTRRLPGKFWPLGLACLCVGIGMLISLFLVV